MTDQHIVAEKDTGADICDIFSHENWILQKTTITFPCLYGENLHSHSTQRVWVCVQHFIISLVNLCSAKNFI